MNIYLSSWISSESALLITRFPFDWLVVTCHSSGSGDQGSKPLHHGAQHRATETGQRGQQGAGTIKTALSPCSVLACRTRHLTAIRYPLSLLRLIHILSRSWLWQIYGLCTGVCRNIQVHTDSTICAIFKFECSADTESCLLWQMQQYRLILD